MKTSEFIQSAISHNLKDPHSEALESDCLSPPLAIITQSPVREGGRRIGGGFDLTKGIGSITLEQNV